jgi:hypothetical protein
VMTLLWAAQQFGVMERRVDALWFSLIGSAVTVAVGMASAALRGGTGSDGDPASRSAAREQGDVGTAGPARGAQ